MPDLVTMTVNQLYEKHIKQLPMPEQLRLVALISQRWMQPSVDESPHSIMELHGLGKEIWQDTDAQDYVEDLRREWDHRR